MSPGNGTDPAHQLHVRYRCDGSADLWVSWDAEHAHRVFVDDVPPSERVRALALAAAEVLGTAPAQRSNAFLPADTLLPESGATAQRDASSIPPSATAEFPIERPPSLPLPQGSAAPKDPPEKPTAPAPHAEAPPAFPEGFLQDDEAPLVDDPETRSRDSYGHIALAARGVLATGPGLFGASATYRTQRWMLGASFLLARKEAQLGDRALGTVQGGIGALRLGYGSRPWHLDSFHLHGELTTGIGLTWARGAAEGDISGRRADAFYAEGRASAVIRYVAWPILTPTFELNLGRSSGIAASSAGATILTTGGWFGGAEAGVSF